MYSYKLLTILKVELDDKKAQVLLKDFVEPTGLKISDYKFIGKKTLAYPINKLNEGVYISATLSGKALDQSALQMSSKQHPEVIRFLITLNN